MLLWPSASTAESSEAMSTEDVTEHRKDVVHVHLTTTEPVKSASAHRACKSKLVILLTFLWVMQHVVGFCSLFEFFLCLLIARVTVRVIFDGNLSVCLLYLVFRGCLLQAKYFVVVSFLCHYY